MLNRNLMAAFITTVICYFIVPFFFDDFYNNYFIIGFAVSFVTVPILFTVGILSSIMIEYFSKKRNYFNYFVKHLACGVVIAYIYQSFAWDLIGFLQTTLIGVIYIIFFGISDYIIKNKYIIK